MKKMEPTKFMVVLIPFHLISSLHSSYVFLLENPLILFKTPCFLCFLYDRNYLLFFLLAFVCMYVEGSVPV